jgi:DNA polymerase-3 subunit beta
MKVACNREKLLHAFQTVATVSPARSTKPILQNVKIEAGSDQVTLMATDLEVGIRYEVAGVEVVTPGAAILSVGRFGSIVRESTDETLQLEADANGVKVRGERSQFQLPAEDPHEFPMVAQFEETAFVTVPVRLFRETIKRTIIATDTESGRYALGGVLLEIEPDHLIAVATDGRRLAKMEGPASGSGSFAKLEGTTIVPSRAMQLLERALADAETEVQLAMRENAVLVKCERATVFAQLLQGRYPRWRDVFPEQRAGTRVELLAGPLYTAVRQAAIFTSEESRGVDFSFSDGLLVLSGQAADVGQSRVELPVPYDGESVAVKLDPRFVMDFLKVLDAGKSFTLELKNAESAVVAHTDDGYSYVIMPLARDR